MKLENIVSVLGVACFLIAGCCHCTHMPDADIEGYWRYSPSANTVALYSGTYQGADSIRTFETPIGVIRMAKNTKFCRPIEDGKKIEYAPVILPPNTGAPTEYEYNEAGWFRNAIEPPMVPDGKVLASTTYQYNEELNAVIAVYVYEDAPPPTLADFDMAMEQYLLEEREARGYTTREPDSYLTSEVPRWAQDARDWVAHRDAVMEYAIELINAVEKGEREPPTIEEFLANMPKIQWTYTAE